MKKLDKLNQIAQNNSNWRSEAEKRRANRHWQKYSQKIAVKILMALRKQNITQKQLAEMIGVSPQQISKIVKGNENLTLQTIAKIEKALDIKILFTEVSKTQILYKEIVKEKIISISEYQTTNETSEKLPYNKGQFYGIDWSICNAEC